MGGQLENLHTLIPCAPWGPIIQIKRFARNSFSTTTERYWQMKCEVTLYVAGKVFKEEVYASNYQEARETALARNPNAKVVGVTAKF